MVETKLREVKHITQGHTARNDLICMCFLLCNIYFLSPDFNVYVLFISICHFFFFCHGEKVSRRANEEEKGDGEDKKR